MAAEPGRQATVAAEPVRAAVAAHLVQGVEEAIETGGRMSVCRSYLFRQENSREILVVHSKKAGSARSSIRIGHCRPRGFTVSIECDMFRRPIRKREDLCIPGRGRPGCVQGLEVR
jgi:hypothetical protein